MRRPPRRRGVPLLTNDLLGRIAVAGSYSAIAALVVMVDPPGHRRARPLAGLHEPRLRPGGPRQREPQRPRADPPPADRTGSCSLLALAVIAIQAAIPYVPLLAEAFHATPLDAVGLGDRRRHRARPGAPRGNGADGHRTDVGGLKTGLSSGGEPRDRPRHQALRRDHGPRRADVRGRRAARSSASSARTAPARRRRCGSASASSGRTPARSAGAADRPAELPRRTWGYLPEERGLYPRMGVLEQLVYFGSLYGETPGPRAARGARLARAASGSPTTPTGGPRSCRRATSRRSSSSPRSSTTPRSC